MEKLDAHPAPCSAAALHTVMDLPCEVQASLSWWPGPVLVPSHMAMSARQGTRWAAAWRRLQPLTWRESCSDISLSCLQTTGQEIPMIIRVAYWLLNGCLLVTLRCMHIDGDVSLEHFLILKALMACRVLPSMLVQMLPL